MNLSVHRIRTHKCTKWLRNTNKLANHPPWWQSTRRKYHLFYWCVTSSVHKTSNTTIQRNQLLQTSSISDASVSSESHLIFMWMLVIVSIWFHSAAASICNVNAAGINPNNIIKFYDAIYHIYGVFRVNEWKSVILKPSKIVLHAACQCKQVKRTSGALEQRALRGVLLICCSPDTTTDPMPRTAFFLYWLFIWKFCITNNAA